MNPIQQQIRDIVDRETRAWDAQDVELLISCFHPAMVWPWPPTPQSHDPMTWGWCFAASTASGGSGAGRGRFTRTTLVQTGGKVRRAECRAEGAERSRGGESATGGAQQVPLGLS